MFESKFAFSKKKIIIIKTLSKCFAPWSIYSLLTNNVFNLMKLKKKLLLLKHTLLHFK